MSISKWISENIVDLQSKDKEAQKTTQVSEQVQTPVYAQSNFQFANQPSPVAPVSQTNDSDLMNKFVEHFQKVFSESNIPGPDYFEFSIMKNTPAMSAVPESSRFSACFAALSVQGLTKQKLIETAQQYVTILDTDAQSFCLQLDEKYKVTVGKMQEEFGQIDDLIKTSSKQIEELNKTILDASAKKQQLSVDISNQEQDIKTKKSYYDFALNQMKQTISEDVNKINQYVQ